MLSSFFFVASNSCLGGTLLLMCKKKKKKRAMRHVKKKKSNETSWAIGMKREGLPMEGVTSSDSHYTKKNSPRVFPTQCWVVCSSGLLSREKLGFNTQKCWHTFYSGNLQHEVYHFTEKWFVSPVGSCYLVIVLSAPEEEPCQLLWYIVSHPPTISLWILTYRFWNQGNNMHHE